MPKAKSHKMKSQPKSHSGKKGGIGVLTPETIGAMAGAAIGGVAGMMLGNRHSKSKLTTVKQSAVTATKSAMSVLEAQAGSELARGKSSGKKNTNTKKTKS